MKLTQTTQTRNLSPTKPRLKIAKTKSLILKSQLAQFSPRSLKTQQSLKQPQLPQVSEQTEYMGMFVEQLAMDPSLLLKLVDYKELMAVVLAESTQIKQKVLQGKTQLENLKKSIFQISGQTQSSTLNMIRKQQNQTTSEIKKYLHLILIERTQRQQKNEEKRIRQRRLQEKIKANVQNHKVQVESILGQIRKITTIKTKLDKEIKQLETKNGRLKHKFQSNKLKATNNLQISSQIVTKKLALGNLKKKQSEELENYKNLMARKKSTEAELKKESEKKLTKFVSELTKVVENMDRKSFNNLIVKYEEHKQEIRQKTFTSDTKPDENEEEQNTLEYLELKNPILKEYKNMNLKTLNQQQILTPLHIKDSNRRIEEEDKKTALLLDQKMKKIGEQEGDLDSFLDALKEKINKMNTQLIPEKGSKK